ncbi:MULTISPECIES: CBS domain-containing protein [Aestuariibaculum]|uniref:CBS domain-containing protein n=1 Tax=Aestuariibaculum lutulentum TaxID=2920935 RepID=A0ABS9RKY3_9FLAO|nr:MULTISPECIES: CBS domain-containing protein [Aestuariibaculum]MCH4553607.1 CBS domain-containing protein [Aestuariibaculum lutulentum]MCR8668299.1 CBS domain-containing protein [Aestuariibaculum sp. M13]
MNALIPVADIMTKNVIALNRTDDLERAEMLFNKYRIKHIPVVGADVVIGMLSFTDLQKISLAEATADEHDINTVVYNSYTIEQVMTKNVITITADTTIKEAATILANSSFHALPVVEEGMLIGIVTTRDLLKYFVKKY